jgi:hypothetical protein
LLRVQGNFFFLAIHFAPIGLLPKSYVHERYLSDILSLFTRPFGIWFD